MTTANESARPGTKPTARELQALRAWDHAPGPHRSRDAAAELGISLNGVEKLLANARSRAGVNRTRHAVRVHAQKGT